MSENKPQPFTSLGQALKNIRVKSAKSQAEVSGAVEIDTDKLMSFELGESRPTEDILVLLIQHFDLSDNEARELWRLAGYEEYSYDNNSQFFTNDLYGDLKNQTLTLPIQDGRIVYTDMIQVMINNYGVIINFMQGAGTGTQPLAVSKVGMSREHAKSVIDVLTKTLEQADKLDNSKKQKSPKRLPSGKNKKE